MVLLMSDLKCPLEGRPDSDTNVSELHGTTILTLFAKLAAVRAAWMLMAAPTTNGSN